MNEQNYDPADWPHGLRCIECDERFIEGQPLGSRPVSMVTYDGNPAFITEIICLNCLGQVEHPDIVDAYRRGYEEGYAALKRDWLAACADRNAENERANRLEAERDNWHASAVADRRKAEALEAAHGIADHIVAALDRLCLRLERVASRL